MPDYVTLIGAEAVQSAGHAIARAADEMKTAAAAVEQALRQHQLFLDDWLSRFHANETMPPPGGSQSPKRDASDVPWEPAPPGAL